MNQLYPSNSDNSKEVQIPEKKVEKVVKSKVQTKKKSEVRKLRDVFLPEDMATVKQYILLDIIIPAVKRALSDVIKSGIDTVLYGESRTSNWSSPGTKVSYRNYYDGNANNSRPAQERSRMSYSYDEIIISDRGEAENVLYQLDELISAYGFASVADLKDLVGITANHTDHNYGWINVKNAMVKRISSGYIINLPKPLPMN